MNPHRLLLAHVLILGVVGGSLYDIATRQEHWPFSNYPMFSTVHRQPKLNWVRLFGVTSDHEEIALVDYDYLWPLDQSRLPLGLRRIIDMKDPARLHAAVADVLDRYERRRLEGRLVGPALEAVRVYRVTWTLEPFAGNLDSPDARLLVAEARLHDGERR